MRTKFIFLIVVFIVILSYSFLELSSEDINQIKISNGKNLIMFNNTADFYVSDLIKLNPKIQVLSFTENDLTIGYVNVYNGVGDNFIIRTGVNYEIIANEDIDLILPNK